MSDKKSDIPGEVFAELEGDYAPFAAAPRFFAKNEQAAMFDDEQVRLVRVLMVFSDGSKQDLLNGDAQEWIERVNACVQMSTIHGLPMKEFQWERWVPSPEEAAERKAVAEFFSGEPR